MCLSWIIISVTLSFLASYTVLLYFGTDMHALLPCIRTKLSTQDFIRYRLTLIFCNTLIVILCRYSLDKHAKLLYYIPPIYRSTYVYCVIILVCIIYKSRPKQAPVSKRSLSFTFFAYLSNLQICLDE